MDIRNKADQASASPAADNAEITAFTLALPYPDLELGESVAVNGVCRTVAALGSGHATFFVSRETCARTSLGALRSGSEVNLERAVRLQDRLSGHLVQGHVDGVGTLVDVVSAGDSRVLLVELPASLSRYVVEKGSIAIDGVSLTVNAVRDPATPTAPAQIELMIIPHTADHTSLGRLRAGAKVNVEVDVLAKYVERLRERSPERLRELPPERMSHALHS